MKKGDKIKVTVADGRKLGDSKIGIISFINSNLMVLDFTTIDGKIIKESYTIVDVLTQDLLKFEKRINNKWELIKREEIVNVGKLL